MLYCKTIVINMIVKLFLKRYCNQPHLHSPNLTVNNSSICKTLHKSSNALRLYFSTLCLLPYTSDTCKCNLSSVGCNCHLKFAWDLLSLLPLPKPSSRSGSRRHSRGCPGSRGRGHERTVTGTNGQYVRWMDGRSGRSGRALSARTRAFLESLSLYARVGVWA